MVIKLPRRFKDYSLRAKLTAAFLAVAVLAVTVVALFTSRVSGAALSNQLGANLNSLAQSQALAAGDLLARQVDALRALSLNRVLRERVHSRNLAYTGSLEAIQAELAALDQSWPEAPPTDLLVQAPLNNIAARELQTFQALFPDHLSVLITDRYGALAAATARPSRYVFAGETWWQAAYKDGEGALYIGLPAFDESGGSFVLPIAMPLYGENSDRVTGVLHTIYRLDSLAALIALEGAGVETALLLSGDLLLDMAAGDLRPLPMGSAPALLTLAEAGYGEATLAGVVSLVSLAPVTAITGEEEIANLGWSVLVSQERAAALAPVTVQRRAIAGLSLLMMAAAVLMAAGLARLLTEPIGRLTRAATQLTGGDLGARAEVETGDEIGALADAFNRMAARLRAMVETLERANQELEQFAYVVSHDLKAPLRAIASLSAWIEEDLGATLTGENRRQMTLLRGRVHRMEALIEGILAYSRVGRIQATTTTVNVGELLSETIDSLAPPPGFVVAVQPGMPTLLTEPVQLGQVFANLISNAIKYHHRADGRVAVTVGENGRFYQFAVADDGPGIAPEYHDKIFAIFQTLQPRDSVESTGVGLAVVKKIVENQGGKIWVQSAEGQGTSFYFTWPKG